MPRLAPSELSAIALASIFLGYALQMNNGFYHLGALALVGAGLVCLLAALWRLPSRVLRLRGTERGVVAVLLAGVLANLALLYEMPIAFYLAERFPVGHPEFRTGIAAAAVTTVLMVLDARRARRVWLPVLLLVYAALGAWLIRQSPNPHIDVMTVHRAALAALAAGTSPYSTTFENIYGDSQFYAPEMLRDGQVLFGLPYPPFSLLMAVPGQMLGGDVRYAELASLVAGAAFIGNASRSLVAPLASALLLFTPRTFFVLEQGWTESLAIGWLGATVYAAQGQRRGAFTALGLFCATKQYLVIALPLLPLLTGYPIRWRAVRHAATRTLVVAAVVTLPFAMWDPAGFWRSVVWLQVLEPFRFDSLSVLSFLARQEVPLPPISVTMATAVALALGLTAVWHTAPRTPGGFALALGFVLLIVFAFSKKAFCNYYFFVLAALAAAVAASAEPDDPQPPDDLGRDRDHPSLRTPPSVTATS